MPLRSAALSILPVAVAMGAAVLAPTPRVAAQEAAEVTAWYEALREPAIDDTRSAEVAGVTLERDAGTFHFEEGRMHLLEPVGDRTFGAVFVGRGSFRLAAPDPVETTQLVRHYETAELDRPFRAAVLLFTDFTLPELSGTLSWAPAEVDGDAEREVREAREYFTDDDGWASPKVLLPLLNAGPGFFYAHFSEDRGDPTIYSVDPHVFEEVALSKRADRGKRPETVAQFHRAVDYSTGRSIPPEGLDLIAISAYDVESDLSDGLDFRGRATVSLRRLQGSYRWVPFSLDPELEVDSIRWGDGTPADFYRADETSDLWVDLAHGSVDTEAELTFHYEGDLLDRPQDLWVTFESYTTWLPVYEFDREISYRLTFHVPDEYVVSTVGTEVERTTADEVTTTVWETGPVRRLTFNVGEFDEFDSEEPGAPPLKVLVNEGAHRRLGGMVAQAGGLLLEQRDMAQNVALDLRNSFRFFNEVYGPTTVDAFTASEIPSSLGVAYPGLVLLAISTFQWTTEQGFDEMFRAHEVAHQWWGISVRPATYRDWWIAEGFSEFSGWWYAARARGSIEMYRRRLKETREELLERRGRSAPIGLGTRVGNSRYPEDYQMTIYHKSAWVLHMLRTILTDPDTGNDDLFTRVMQTFYTNHLGRTASTASFRATVEEVVGADMGWFFEQWVYGSDIPTYTFSYDLEDQPDGRVKARIRVRQEDVPEDFRMIVPIMVDFGDRGSGFVNVNVTGAVTEGELPLLPSRPEDIVFNPHESVLAETRTERWRN